MEYVGRNMKESDDVIADCPIYRKLQSCVPGCTGKVPAGDVETHLGENGSLWLKLAAVEEVHLCASCNLPVVVANKHNGSNSNSNSRGTRNNNEAGSSANGHVNNGASTSASLSHVKNNPVMKRARGRPPK